MPLTSIFKTTIIKFAKYLLALVNIVKEDGVDKSKYKNIEKRKNEIGKISIKLKY